MVTHWLFTSHYLSMAMNFSLTMSASDLKTQQKRKYFLLAIDITIYSMAVILFLLDMFGFKLSKAMFEIYWVVQIWTLSLVSGYSFWKITKNTRQLEGVGIFADKNFMILYFSFIFCATMSSTIAQIIEINVTPEERRTNDEKSVRLSILARSFMCVD